LQLHLRSHSGAKPYSCLMCAKSFSRSDTLKSHLKVHTDENPHSCKQCSKSFSQAVRLQIHSRIHTGETLNHTIATSVRSYFQIYSACKLVSKFTLLKNPTIAPKSFASMSKLKRHLRVHSGKEPGKKPYSCFLCTDVFALSGAFQEHLRVHF
jgi:KRAB domain-containing zinc finger protein